jgi:hypothetical protein
MMMMAERKPGTCLVRLASNATLREGWYKGTSNRYLNIDAVRMQANDDAAAVELPFDKQLLALGSDDKALPAAANPWKEKAPLLLLQGSLKPTELLAAFRLDFNNVSGLTVPDPAAGPKALAVVGMKDSPWGDPEWKPDDINPGGGTASATAKVVDPREKTDTARGVYGSLQAALADTRPGETITLTIRGDLEVDQLQQIKANVTLRADGDSHPLIRVKSLGEPQAALFRVQGGQLTLENLEFRLRPSNDGRLEAQSVALLCGEGSVAFKRCLVTLDGRDSALPLAAVILPDFKEAMLQPGALGVPPKILFESCVIRGSGDLVSARASRPFELEVNDSLAAVTGSLLNVDAGPRVTDAPQKPEIPVRLNQVTAYLGGHLVRLRAASLGSLMPVHCLPSKSLIVCAGSRRALLHVEAGPKDIDGARKRLPMSGNGNTYANFSCMLDQQPGDIESTTTAVTQEGWKDYESETRFEEVKFAGKLWTDAGDLSAADVAPKDFVVMTGPKDGKGAPLQRLPTPAER